eukprot:SM000202S05888  [mRNA]  locus=s202:135805:139689:+ [translate_table: standard]
MGAAGSAPTPSEQAEPVREPLLGAASGSHGIERARKDDELAAPDPEKQERPGDSIQRATGVGVEKTSIGSVAFLMLVSLTIALGPFSFGYSLGYTSPALPEMTDDLGLSTGQASLFAALVTAGAMLGALASGSLADRLGRKFCLAAAAVPNIGGWLMIAFTKHVPPLYVGRVLVGFGTGVFSFGAPVYIAEVAPAEWRGTMGTVNQLAITLGIMAVYALGIALSWRALASAGTIALLLLLLGLLIIPETPRWLARHGTKEQLIASLQILRGKGHSIHAELTEIQDTVEASKAQPRARLTDLFSPSLRKPLVAGIGLMVFQQFSGINSIIFYAGSIFNDFNPELANQFAFYLTALQVVLTCVTAGIMDRMPRRTLLMVKLVTSWLLMHDSWSCLHKTCCTFCFRKRPVRFAYLCSKVCALAVSCSLFRQPAQLTMVGYYTVLHIREKSENLSCCNDMSQLSGTGMALSMFVFVYALHSQPSPHEGRKQAGNQMLMLASLLMYISSFALGLGAVPWIIVSEIFPVRVRGLAGSLAALFNWSSAFLVTQTFGWLRKRSATGTFSGYGVLCLLLVAFVALFVPETRGRTLEEIEALFGIK